MENVEDDVQKLPRRIAEQFDVRPCPNRFWVNLRSIFSKRYPFLTWVSSASITRV